MTLLILCAFGLACGAFGFTLAMVTHANARKIGGILFCNAGRLNVSFSIRCVKG